MVATGSFAAWREVRSVDALTATRYGDLLLVKVALVLAMLGLGALGLRWVRRSSPALLRRSVLLEAGIAAAVVGTTAVLVQTPPARTAYAAPISVRTDLGPAGAVQVELDSARVGLNTLHVYLTGAGGKAVDVPEVTARLTRSDGESATAPVPRESLGHYETTRLAVPFRGTWRLDVAVRTTDVDVSTATVTATFR
jgi:copper transport protein